jgi:hypothetical protein
MFDNIPEEIKTYPQWIVWRYGETQNGRQTKLPYQLNGHLATVNEPTHWALFSACVEAVRQGKFNGIGFCLTANDPFTIIDLDAVKDETLTLEEANAVLVDQRKIYEALGSYSELSPSGNGLHIVTKARLYGPGKRRHCVELYDRDRYMTFTGNVYQALRPIEVRQYQIERLYDDMMEKSGGKRLADNTWADAPEQETDQEIYDRAANADNGEKFVKLFDAEWQDQIDSRTGKPYGTHSEADQALINMFAFYTRNMEQIYRLYKWSKLGNDPKDKFKHRWQRRDYVMRSINLSLDRAIVPVPMEDVHASLQAYLARQLTAPTLSPAPAPAPLPQIVDNPYQFPPGLIGELAQFFFEAAILPIPEIALATALAYHAGIVGSVYNVSGTGLNIYLMVLAKTGRGKGAIANGMSKLDYYLKQHSSALPQLGQELLSPRLPNNIASSQALQKNLARMKSGVWVIGEMALTFCMNDDKASPAEKMLKGTVLDVYNKSGQSDFGLDMAYSDKDKDVKGIQSPALTLIGESVPDTLYASLDKNAIKSGMLPRFSIIDYRGDRPDNNWEAENVKPSPDLLAKVFRLHQNCAAMMIDGKRSYIHTSFTPGAIEAHRAFARFIKDTINNVTKDKDAVIEMWNRAHIKALKLAANVAVGINPTFPLVDEDCWNWAKRFVMYETNMFIDRFDRGEIGGALGVDAATPDMTQAREVAKFLVSFFLTPFDDLGSRRQHTQSRFHDKKAIPLGLINNRFSQNALFKDRRGSAEAVKRAINILIEHGALQYVNGGTKDCENLFGPKVNAKLVRVIDMDRLGMDGVESALG